MENIEERLTQLLDKLPVLTGEQMCELGETQQKSLLESCVFELEQELYVFKDMPNQTIERLDIMFNRLRQLTAGKDSWCLLVDLRHVRPPDAGVRAHLQKVYVDLERLGLRFVSLVVANKIIELTVKLVGSREIRVPYAISHRFGTGISHVRAFKKSQAPKPN